MRPRVFPAEDSPSLVRVSRTDSCFNEAAGIPRGRQEGQVLTEQPPRIASMRPRVFPAEDSVRTSETRCRA